MTSTPPQVNVAAWEPVTLVGRHIRSGPSAPQHAADLYYAGQVPGSRAYLPPATFTSFTSFEDTTQWIAQARVSPRARDQPAYRAFTVSDGVWGAVLETSEVELLPKDGCR